MPQTNPHATESALSRWLSGLAADHRRACLALAVTSLVCFLPGFFSLPAIDRDEARYAQASRQMVVSGDWVDIRLQDAPRHKQPAGIYWAQSLFVKLLGNDGVAPIWVHRLPSLISATVGVLLTYWIGLPLVGSRSSLLAGLLMAGSVILGVEARLAKTDATLLVTVLAAQGVLVRCYLAHKEGKPEGFSGRKAWLLPLLFWTALAAGFLVKGPLVLLFVGLTVVSLSISEHSVRFLALLKPMPGLLWFLALVLPWYIAIGFRTNGAFYEKAIGFSIIGKISQGHEGHGAPPLTHVAWFWGIFWPGSLLLAMSVPEIWRRRREPWLHFLICWVVPSWIAFELISTKLPHYLLPVFPALAIAAAATLSERETLIAGQTGKRILITISAILSVGASLATATALWFACGNTFSIGWMLLSLTTLALFFGVLVVISRSLARQDLSVLIASLLIGVSTIYWFAYPSIARTPMLWPGKALIAMIESGKKCERPFLISAGYDEASLVFNTRTDILLTEGGDAAKKMALNPCSIAIVESRQMEAFMEELKDLNVRVEETGKITCFNIGGGRMLNLTVFRNK